ncbi:MAG: PAS domain S-box protein [Acidobacteria bacterium]|nr:PAS domain S-box protein [Acidobacteriota bacterium]
MMRRTGTVVTLVAVVSLMVTGAIFGIGAVRRSLVARAVRSCGVWLPAVAVGRRQAVQDWLEAGLRDAAFVGSYPEALKAAGGTVSPVRAVELLNTIAAAHGYRHIRIVDERGRVVAESTPGLPGSSPPVPLGASPARVGAPVGLESGPSGSRFVVFRAAVGEKGTVEILDHSVAELGSMVATPGGFAHDVRTVILQRASTGSWTMLDSAGVTVPATAEIVRMVEETVAASGPLSEIVLPDGRPGFAAALPVSGTGWWIVSTVGRRDVLAGALHEALQLGWLIGVLLALALAVGLGLWRHQRSRHYRELARSEVRYRTLFQSAPVSLWEEDLSGLKVELDRLAGRVGDLESFLRQRPEELRRLLATVRIIDVNRATLQLYGASSKEELANALNDLVTEEAAPALAAEMAALARGERQVSIQVDTAALDREPLTVLVHVSIPPGAEGYRSATVAVVDLTRQEAALRLVEASERRYRLLFDSAADAIFIHDFEGRMLDVNELACRRLGYSREELLSMTPGDFTPPEVSELLPERLQKIREAGSLVFQSTHVARDGRAIPVEINARVVELDGRKVVLSLARDVSERRAALKRITFLNRLLQTRSAVTRLTITERDRQRLLDGACSILVNEGGFGLAWILEVDAERGGARVTAVSDPENSFLDAVRQSVERNLWGTPCGETLRSGRPTIINELLGETGDSLGLRQAAIEKGYRSMAVFRIEAGGRVAGTVGICSESPGVFGEEVEELLRELASDLAFALEAMETRQALGRSEELYRLLAEQAQDVVYRFRLQAPVGFEYISPSVERVLGYGADEILSNPRLPLRALHREDRSKALSLLRGQLESGKALILRWYRRDGMVAWIETLNTVLLDEEGRAEVLLGVGRDITERVRAEQRYRMLFERNLAGVYRSAIDGRMIDCNEAFARIFGFESREELLEYSAWDLYGDRAVRRRFLAELWRKRALAAYEQPMVRRDGSPLWVVLSAVVVPDEHGQLTEIEGTLMDLTERRGMEEELRNTARRLEQAQRVAHVGNWEWDPGSGAVYWSEELYRIVGLEPRDFSTPFEGFLDRVHPEDVERVRRAESLALSGEQEYTIEYRLLRPDGSVRWVVDRAEVVRDAVGNPVRLFGTIQDITERRVLEEQLLQAQKMEAIGRLAGGIAHDFNNILQAMMMFGERLRMSAGEAGEALIGELSEQMQRAAALTRQLLLFSRQETAHPEDLDLGQVVTGLTTMLRRLLRENIEFRVIPSPDPLPLVADRAQLEQVLMNLVVNAADAMPEGGRLEVRVGPDSERTGWARLEVEDTGQGIPDDIRERIFEPFFTTKPVGKGTGLGLSVVHGIVTGHGGLVEVDSSPEEGTTFRVMLPLGEGLVDVSCGPSAGKPLPRGRGERLLLVEDHPAVRESLVVTLESLGYRVTGVERAEEAVAVDLDSIDLVLSDQVLPGMSGLELCERLREQRPDLPIILMSGYTDDAELNALVRGGKVRFLQKPARLQVLATELRRTLGDGEG